METIKIGDIVRVSDKIPQIYRKVNSMSVFEQTFKVLEIDRDDMALLDSTPPKYVTLIPLKYLVKVNAESKEPTTAEELAEPLDFKKAAEDWATTISNGIREYGENVCRIKEEGSVEAYWDVYTADLAKEIVLKIAGSQLHNHKPQEIGRMAVEIAKSVVENLKEREE